MPLREKHKMSRSVRLKRYESVYTKAIKRGGTGTASKSKIRKSPRKSSRKKTCTTMKTKPRVPLQSTCKQQPNTITSLKERSKRRLTTYQKFVKTESRKPKYKNMAPMDRMTAIGAMWNKNKKNLHKN